MPAGDAIPGDDAHGDGTHTGRFLVVIGLSRWVGNVMLRFPYVLITPLSAGLGISIPTATALLGVRELGGLASPAAGSIADRGHERSVMLTLGTVAGVTCLAIALDPPLWLFAGLMLASGIAKFGYDTAQSAWIGHNIAFHRRGMTFGLIEAGWAFAFLIGGPLCAWLTSRYGWRAPFALVGVLWLVGTVAVRLVMTRDRPEAGSPVAGLGSLVRWRPPAGTGGLYLYAVLQPFCQMFVFAVAGDWFVTNLGMSLSGLGWNTTLIGISELVGTVATAWTSDRFGKRRGAIAGLMVVIPAAAALTLVGNRAVLGVALLCVYAAGIEFSFVSALPLFSEVDPDARAAALGAMIALATMSRAVSAAIAGWVFVRAGIGAIGWVAAALSLAAVVALVASHEPAHAGPVSRRP